MFRNVKVLLGKDTCNVASEDNSGMTPLHIACQNGHTKVVEMLLAKGTDVEHKNAHGYTPLNLATRGGHRETAKLLLSE